MNAQERTRLVAATRATVAAAALGPATTAEAVATGPAPATAVETAMTTAGPAPLTTVAADPDPEHARPVHGRVRDTGRDERDAESDES